nr:immunoglobulin light chain junction region [Macaca mulatta]
DFYCQSYDSSLSARLF